ncbi:MAG: hydroxymethylpyrimidine/phosphomethylpyrimidine kinase [Limnobacter sp.]|nr:hydroxymethylpyrimidine/phosphomethylpyrimidine kinase [Limnobacter sp.]
MTLDIPLILAFSASDPTAGAGMQADVLTIASMGAHPLAVLTGLTAQNTQGVEHAQGLDAFWLNAQLDALLADVHAPAAIKAGALLTGQAVELVSRAAGLFPQAPLVLDPVMASGRGDTLGGKAVFDTMKHTLFAHTTLITPNWLEGKALTGKRLPDKMAAALLDMGCGAVLLKGEHQPGQVHTGHIVNRLYLQDGQVHEFPCARLAGSFHGSGCTLASACAVALARGLPLPEAVELALGYTHAALEHGFEVGSGQRIPDRLHLMQHIQGVAQPASNP